MRKEEYIGIFTTIPLQERVTKCDFSFLFNSKINTTHELDFYVKTLPRNHRKYDFLSDPWWQNHRIWPTFGQVIFLVPDFQAQTLDCTWLCQLCCILIALLLDTMPKRKLFNIANLGAWAKSTVTM